MNLNKVFVLGNVTRDPETRALPSGQQVCSFGLATNRFYTDQAGVKKQEAEFHNIVTFGKLAEIASRYITKGGMVLIEGRIKTFSWQGNDGVKKYKTEIIAESLQLGPRGAGSAPAGNNAGYQKPAQAPAQAKTDDIPIIEENYTPPATNNFEAGEGEIDVKDIPF